MTKVSKYILVLAVIISLFVTGCSVGMTGYNGIDITGYPGNNSISFGINSAYIQSLIGNATGNTTLVFIGDMGNSTPTAGGNFGLYGSGSVSTVCIGSYCDIVGAENVDYATIAGNGGVTGVVAGTGTGVSANTGNVTITNTQPYTGQGVTGVVAGTGTGVSANTGNVTITNTQPYTGQGVTGVVAGTGISMSANTGNVTITNTAPEVGAQGFTSGCMASLHSNQSIAISTPILLNLLMDWDIGGQFSNSTHLFTAAAAGYYLVTQNAYATSGTAARYLESYFLVNGAGLFVAMGFQQTSAVNSVITTGVQIVYLNAGDTLGLYAVQSIANPRDILAGLTLITIYRIA